MNLSRRKRKLHTAPIAILAIVAACVFAVAPRAFAAEISGREQVGVPFIGSRGVQRSMMDIMFEQSLHNADSPGTPLMGNEHEFSKEGARLNPASPRVASIPQMPVSQMVYKPKGLPNQVFSPQAVGPSFTAATLSGTNSTGSFPPDCNGAVGPTQYIIAVNGRIVSFNKTTGVADGVMNATTNTFFTSVRNTSGTSDPMIRYDRLSNRWFISIINVSTPNRWLLGVSDAASNGVISAGTVWTYYFFIPATTSPTISNGSTCLSDYPSLGIDANALYTGVSEFCGTGQPFQQTDVFVIRKTSVLSGGPIVVTAFRGLMTATGGYVGPFSARGLDNYDPSSNEGYFVGTDGASFGQMWINRVGTPGGTPTISANIGVTLPSEGGARPVPHPGNTGGYWGRVDPLDDRYFAAHIRNQQLWTTHNIGVDNTGVGTGVYLNDTRVGSRWFHINVPVNSGTPTIVESGTVFTASATNDSIQKNYFIPSIMVSGQGHAAMAFSTAGENDNINCATVGRLASDPAGTMETPVAITTNTNTYNPTSDPGGISAGRPRRWGDYTQTSVDPLDDQSMWTVQEFCDANNSYGVRVARLLGPGPATPSALADVQAGQASASVTLTGTSTLGTGFFDPGANLASPALAFKHISAAVTNGAATGTPPTVVSATYVDPTHVTLVLNTTSATANIGAEKYTVTVTNPDGQTAAAAVVRITPSSFTITASAGTGGSISPSGAVSVNPGGNQSFTITPDGCHTIANVLVDGGSVGAVSSYTFTNVQAAHTIAASFNVIVETITATAGANGTITPVGAVAVNCGSNQAFTITPASCYHVNDVLADGVSVGAVSSYTFTNVTAAHTIDASFAFGVPAPAAVTGLTVTQVKVGNGSSGTTKVTLAFTAPGGGTTVEVWRKGFGSYPLYNLAPGTGSAPTLPGSYPPAGWTLTGVTVTGQTDQPASRDFYYYAAYAKDACTGVSAVSNMTNGTLDYHLGDWSDGITAGQGDNTVNTADASLLGAHYGAAGGALSGFEYLDVGPTTSGTTNGRPNPDGLVDFEDLVMLAINYAPNVSLVTKVSPAMTHSAPAGLHAVDALMVADPGTVSAGQVFDVPVMLNGSGDLLALSMTLGWNSAVVTPIDVSAGDLLASQGGIVMSPGPGRADATLLGPTTGMNGQGPVAVVRFRAIAAGVPRVSIASVVGRDLANQNVAVAVQNPLAVQSVVHSTELFPVAPNPSRGSSLLLFSLAKQGPVDLSIYSVDGRHVKTIVHGIQEVGRYQFSWDGRDAQGSMTQSGLYFVRLEAAGARTSRLLSVIR